MVLPQTLYKSHFSWLFLALVVQGLKYYPVKWKKKEKKSFEKVQNITS